MKLGVFGGTFNPIHFGHLRAAEEVRDLCGLDRILFIPSGVPPLKDTDLAAAEHRYAMTAAAAASNPNFAVTDIELRDPGRSFTVNTLGTVRAHYPGDEIFLILGIDAFLEIPLWWRPETLVEMVDFIVVSRPGHPVGDVWRSPYVELGTRHAGALTGIDTPPAFVEGNDSAAAGCSLDLRSGRRVLLRPVTPLDISSTAIRKLLRSGRSITYLVPGEVEAYIFARGLYRD